MVPTRLLIAAGALALSLACSGPAVQFDYDAKAPFPAYQSYAWQTTARDGPRRAASFENAIVSGRVQRAVDVELKAKGFRPQPEAGNPDFLVTYYPLGEPSRSQQVHLGLGFGMGPLGLGIAAPIGDPRPEAVAAIVLEVLDFRSGTIVWKASATGALLGSDSPEEADRDVKEAVHSMLMRFPLRADKRWPPPRATATAWVRYSETEIAIWSWG